MKIKFNSTYVKWGLTIFCTGALLIMFFFTAQRVGDVTRIFSVLTDILEPFIIGFVLAYLLCPVFNAIVRKLKPKLEEKLGDEAKAFARSKLIALISSVVLMIGIVAGLLYMVIPALVSTIQDLVNTLPGQVEQLVSWLEVKAENYTGWESAETVIETANNKLMDWLTNQVLPKSMTIVDGIASGVIGIVQLVLDIIIGFIAMIYMLAGKDTFVAQAKKLTYTCFKEENADKIVSGGRVVNDVFNRYISSNLVDGMIIGIITYLFMLIAGYEYAVLIAVIVGVTNLIPFFGPFIGAIPSVLLLLTDKPSHAFVFLIYILIIQQIDGNVIKPKIFGEGVGLPSFWVMFAIILGGGLFGFIGMLIGVPVFALIYQFIGYRSNVRLGKKDMSTDLAQYKNLQVYEERNRKARPIFSRLRRKKDDNDK